MENNTYVTPYQHGKEHEPSIATAKDWDTMRSIIFKLKIVQEHNLQFFESNSYAIVLFSNTLAKTPKNVITIVGEVLLEKNNTVVKDEHDEITSAVENPKQEQTLNQEELWLVPSQQIDLRRKGGTRSSRGREVRKQELSSRCSHSKFLNLLAIPTSGRIVQDAPQRQRDEQRRERVPQHFR